MNRIKQIRGLITGAFLIVPLLSSAISTLHILHFMQLGNYWWMSLTLATAFEIGSISSLLTLTILDKLNKFLVWFIFWTLAFMQIIGNIYFSFDYLNANLSANPHFLDSFVELFWFIFDGDIRLAKFTASIIIGLPIPLISLSFLKSLVDYVKLPTEEEMEEEKKKEKINKPKDIVEYKSEEDILIEKALKEVESGYVEVKKSEKVKSEVIVEIIEEEIKKENIVELIPDKTIIESTITQPTAIEFTVVEPTIVDIIPSDIINFEQSKDINSAALENTEKVKKERINTNVDGNMINDIAIKNSVRAEFKPANDRILKIEEELNNIYPDDESTLPKQKKDKKRVNISQK